MQNIIPVDFSRVGNSPDGNWLVGGPGLAGSCAVRALVFAPGEGEESVREAAVDRFCFIIDGAGSAFIGTDSFALSPRTLVYIPAGMPHHIENADASRPLAMIEAFAGAPPSTLFNVAAVRKVENPAQYIRVVHNDAFTKDGFAYQSLIERKTGSQNLRINFVEVKPGAGSPDYHIHEFDQFYFILDGEMTVDIGKRRQVAGRHHFIHLPAGIVHRNYNAGSVPEVHFALLAPEPKPGEIFDYAVEIHTREAELLRKIPA